jgi:2-polyprenyl-6-methoxyphenol hydroxylase-like FAD-dependent oxidoreductase
MASVAIVGGGISGLAAALYLSKQDHQVTIFERDDAPTPETAAEAFAWDRRGAPQVRHSHAMLARLRNLLREDHPEVLARLLDAGASELKMYESMPTGPGIGEIEPEDKQIVMIASRRTTLEWVLRTSILDSGCAEFRSGIGVKGLSATPGEIPNVDGVVLDDGTLHKSDIVIAADGRKSVSPSWLEELGIKLRPEIREPTGIVYFSRFYQLREGEAFPTADLVAGDLGYMGYAAFGGDNGTFSVTFSTADDDATLRRAVKDPEAFEKIARSIPAIEAWVIRAEPMTQVHSMAGLINRRRHFTRGDAPVVTGFHAIGDAHVCTNPAYGRGLSTGFWQAQLLAKAIEAHPTAAADQSLQFCQEVAIHVVPWFDTSVMMDRNRLLERAQQAKSPDPGKTPDNPMAAIVTATRVDANVWRRFWRTMNLLAPPTTLMQPEFLAMIGAALSKAKASGEVDLKPAKNGPSRTEILALLELTEA